MSIPMDPAKAAPQKVAVHKAARVALFCARTSFFIVMVSKSSVVPSRVGEMPPAIARVAIAAFLTSMTLREGFCLPVPIFHHPAGMAQVKPETTHYGPFHPAAIPPAFAGYTTRPWHF
jgi:hypothetical protein